MMKASTVWETVRFQHGPSPDDDWPPIVPLRRQGPSPPLVIPAQAGAQSYNQDPAGGSAKPSPSDVTSEDRSFPTGK